MSIKNWAEKSQWKSPTASLQAVKKGLRKEDGCQHRNSCKEQITQNILPTSH